MDVLWIALQSLPVQEMPNDIDPRRVTPGLWGFVFFIGLGVATVVLWRFMNGSIRHIDPDLPRDPGSTGRGRRPSGKGE